MKAIICVNFKTIKGLKVDGKMLEKIPQLFPTTEKTTKILCENIKKYFKEHKINVNVTWDLEE